MPEPKSTFYTFVDKAWTNRFSGGFLFLNILLLSFIFSNPIHTETSPKLDSGEKTEVFNQMMLNWSGHDYNPRITPDGRYMIFQSDRPAQFEDQNLWFSENLAFPDFSVEPRWSVPQTLFFPLSMNATKTMQVFRPSGTQLDPDGTFSVNTDSFEGMASYVFRKNEPVEIYFTSVRNKQNHREGYSGLNIYFSRYRDNLWSEVSHLNVINSDFDDRMPVVSNDGMRMYFVSNRPGGFGGSDIWYSERNLKTGVWSNPVNAGSVFNTQYNEIAPTLVSRDQILMFSSDRPGGFGHYDLYMSRYNGMKWEDVKNLGEPFNSPRDDEYLTTTDDGLWSYFSSDRLNTNSKGGYDIYRMRTPQWLVAYESIVLYANIIDGATRLPLGTEATVKILYEKETIVESSKIRRKMDSTVESNNYSIKLASNRQYRMIVSAPGFHPVEIILDYTGTMGARGIDRRTIVLQPIVEKIDNVEEVFSSLAGRVVNKVNGTPVAHAQIEMTSTWFKEKILLKVDSDGRFAVRAVQNKVFTLIAKAPGFEDLSMNFTARPEFKVILMRMQPLAGIEPCKNLEIGCIDKSRVYFKTNSSVIEASQVEVLERIALILKQNSKVDIFITGHTDQVFTRDYNLRLSEDRARSVQAWLVAKGIVKERLSVTGYGFLKPVIPTEKTEEDRQQNRRVEFRVKGASDNSNKIE